MVETYIFYWIIVFLVPFDENVFSLVHFNANTDQNELLGNRMIREQFKIMSESVELEFLN